MLDSRRKRRGTVIAVRRADKRHVFTAESGGRGSADIHRNPLPTPGPQLPQVVRGDRTGGECVGECLADPQRRREKRVRAGDRDLAGRGTRAVAQGHQFVEGVHCVSFQAEATSTTLRPGTCTGQERSGGVLGLRERDDPRHGVQERRIEQLRPALPGGLATERRRADRVDPEQGDAAQDERQDVAGALGKSANPRDPEVLQTGKRTSGDGTANRVGCACRALFAQRLARRSEFGAVEDMRGELCGQLGSQWQR
ncbi:MULTISPECIES: hypothetical protein [Amycolatopsis]|uniref:hypothetical protein n=1 Tax=Amycolatopsis TaxID=1813 RepID=UPI001E2B949D|nr:MULTISPECIES: hypothetical protein [Amycolatopsis]